MTMALVDDLTMLKSFVGELIMLKSFVGEPWGFAVMTLGLCSHALVLKSWSKIHDFTSLLQPEAFCSREVMNLGTPTLIF